MKENSIAIPFDAEMFREKTLAKALRKLEILFKKAVRRTIDIVVAVIGLVLMIPLTILIVLQKIISRDFTKVICGQLRMGKNGKLFNMYKFNVRKGTEQADFLDKTSIDEWPQFINILIGNMTLVGPRPYRPEEKEQMGTYFNYISQLKPGLTGVYQICGKTKMSFYDRMDMDTRYFYNRRFWTDMKILLITIFITARRKQVVKFADYTYTTIKDVITIFLKRIIDICGALVGITILIPLTAIVWIVNFISGDKGPLFYSQERIGRFGKHFKMYKFRSMVVNAEEKLQKMLEEDEELRKEFETTRKLKHDPRITKIGNFLRKTSLDEFPQFVNVLKGEMSLVGPRAVIDGEIELFGENKQVVLSVKPGVTGYWASHGRSGTSYEERVEMESYYAKNISIGLDIEILFKTVWSVIKKEGAV